MLGLQVLIKEFEISLLLNTRIMAALRTDDGRSQINGNNRMFNFNSSVVLIIHEICQVAISEYLSQRQFASQSSNIQFVQLQSFAKNQVKFLEFKEGNLDDLSSRARCLIYRVINEPQFIVPQCNPNFRNPESPYIFFKGPYSIIRKCLYNKEVNNYVFDYGKQFLNTYQNEKKYLQLQLFDGHEGIGDAIGYLIDPLFDFLQLLSVIMLQSDHGLHMQGQYYVMGLEQFFIEIYLPGFFAIKDKNLFREEQHYINQQQNKQTSFKNSIISSTIKDKRNCSNIPQPMEQKSFGFDLIHYYLQFILRNEIIFRQYQQIELQIFYQYDHLHMLAGKIRKNEIYKDLLIYWNIKSMNILLYPTNNQSMLQHFELKQIQHQICKNRYIKARFDSESIRINPFNSI
ncbi:hypothetical protein pb186bvf_005306 [Paramecium bursaria]